MSGIEAKGRTDAVVHRVLRRHGMTDVMIVRGVAVEGRYLDEFSELGAGEDSVAGRVRTFDCRASDLPSPPLEPDDVVTIEGRGQARFIRDEPYGEGRVRILLGSFL